MLYKLDKDNSDEVRIKALFAISCKFSFLEGYMENLINFLK
jgi:hypothetical protein